MKTSNIYKILCLNALFVGSNPFGRYFKFHEIEIEMEFRCCVFAVDTRGATNFGNSRHKQSRAKQMKFLWNACHCSNIVNRFRWEFPRKRNPDHFTQMKMILLIFPLDSHFGSIETITVTSWWWRRRLSLMSHFITLQRKPINLSLSLTIRMMAGKRYGPIQWIIFFSFLVFYTQLLIMSLNSLSVSLCWY